MSDGVVVVAGIFPQGSVVTLTKVANEGVQRSEGGEEVGRRQVDADGNVGWDGLEVGACYLVDGYAEGYPVTVRAKATDVAEQSNDLSQAPPAPPPVTIGTQQAPAPVVLPEPSAEELPVGVPDGVSISQVGAKTYYLHVGTGEINATGWAESGLQEPAVIPAEGDTLPPEPLYVWTGDDEPDLGVEDGKAEWEAYEGPTEPVGTSVEDSSLTAAAPEPVAEPQQPQGLPEDAPIPPQPHPESELSVTTGASTTTSVEPVQEAAAVEPTPVGATDTSPAGSESTPVPQDGGAPPADAPAAPPAGPAADVPADSPAQPAPDPAAQPPVSDAPPAQSDAPAPGPEPTASESSGTGDQAGGAVESAPSADTVPPAETPATSGAADAGTGPASAATDQAASSDAASNSARDQLVAQAEGLGVANAATLTESDLRAQIVEHAGTPVA